ncbi:hypothetical protein [Blastopirellula marina]|uniref:Uncharacterized protein n=1 Tax=Blastopirellula marina TaxID=124 RepID=A0A2S8FCT6_9BACT|nr:hypothetical protein [Blastopirellula marina]PQO29986.1 hypothetical protein C5Y98_22255 [Blastopirellula marina]PTL42454.1 hypothetical protein C5Y97_22265 [Blastopirellula marina]
MDRSARCILYEPHPCWAPRLRAVSPTSAGFTEARVASEVDKLLSEESHRLLLIVLRQTMSATQCAARLRQAAATHVRWPNCQVLLLMDEEMEAWHRAAWEMGSGLVFVGSRSVPKLAKTIDRLLQALPADEETTEVQDPLDWLPW